MMPITAFQRRIAGNRDVDSIYVAADDQTPTDELQSASRTSCAMPAACRRTATTISTCAT